MINIFSKKKYKIFLRDKIHTVFRIIKKIFKILFNRDIDKIRNILVYPAVRNEVILADILNRILWAFPYKIDLKIFVLVSDELKSVDIGKLNTPEFQSRYLSNYNHIELISKNELPDSANIDLYLVHNWKDVVKFIFSLKLHKVEIIDKNYFSIVEGSVWRDYYFNTFDDQEKIHFQELSKENFISLKEKVKNKKTSFLFLTGPSFSNYENIVFPQDSIKILCNTIIKNEAFLNYINNFDILAFGDPVFHFSSCEYASIYRNNVLETVKKYNNYIIVPEETVPLLLAHYPEIQKYIIGLNRKSKQIIFPDENNLAVKPGLSVVTYYMLPIASAFSDKIYLIGADGRQKTENYFWKHNSSVQYDDLMNSVFQTHPSFFRDRDYSDYYEKHCEYFEEFLQFGEKKGIQYKSLTPSFIPALQKREINENEKRLFYK